MQEASSLTRRRFLMLAATATALGSQTIGSLPAAARYGGEGYVGKPAQPWEILEWINGDGGNVDTLRGKVVVIDFFQLWCPGCNKFSGPLMTRWQKKFATEIEAGRLALVKIHTVFEGHDYQTVTRLKRYIKKKAITIPVGVDRHENGSRLPTTMKRYRTRGTPEMAIIDKHGVIRFQHFGGFEIAPVETLLGELLDKQAA